MKHGIIVRGHIELKKNLECSSKISFSKVKRIQ